jgi:hypothetical protein
LTNAGDVVKVTHCEAAKTAHRTIFGFASRQMKETIIKEEAMKAHTRITAGPVVVNEPGPPEDDG